jgi:hypothetical protein
MNALREPVFEATQGGIAVTVFKATPESTKLGSRPTLEKQFYFFDRFEHKIKSYVINSI